MYIEILPAVSRIERGQSAEHVKAITTAQKHAESRKMTRLRHFRS